MAAFNKEDMAILYSVQAGQCLLCVINIHQDPQIALEMYERLYNQFAQIRLILHMLRNTENVFCRAAHKLYYVSPISTKTIIPVNFKVYWHTSMFTGETTFVAS